MLGKLVSALPGHQVGKLAAGAELVAGRLGKLPIDPRQVVLVQNVKVELLFFCLSVLRIRSAGSIPRNHLRVGLSVLQIGVLPLLPPRSILAPLTTPTPIHKASFLKTFFRN